MSVTSAFRTRLACRSVVLAAALVMTAGPVPAPQAQEAPQAADTGATSIDQRVRQIEEQILDIQTLLGTLQSLVRSGGGAAAASAPGGLSAGSISPSDGGDTDQRMRVMETQINALSRQVEQLTGQLANLGVSGSDQPASQAVPGQAGGQLPPPQFGTVTLPPEQQQQQQQPQWPMGPVITQSPQSQQPVPSQPQPGQLPPGLRGTDGQGAQPQGAQLQAAQPQETPPPAAAPGPVAALSPEQARVLYDQAYGNLVRRDYATAEQGFRQFLGSFPADPLAGNAQYWLGETFFLRNQYKQAAESFLKAYQRYPASSKAAESLLRLGTSLAQLGNRDEACATIAEVGRKFPDAPDYLKQRAATESRRAGC